MDGGKRIGEWLYKDILLKAAEKYEWDQSAVTDLYVQNVYEETGGDVERFVKGIYDHARKDKKLVTKEALMELLDSYGVIDPVNTPRTRDLVKFGGVTPQVPYRLPEQDGFNMQDAIDPLQAIRTPMDIQLDDVDGYYDSMQRLTPPQKEAMALRRFQSAQKAILGKYGNGEEGQTRLQEQRATIIKDFNLEEVDGQVRVKPAELEAYKVYCQGALYGSLQEDEEKVLADDDWVGRAEAYNEEFDILEKDLPPEKNYYSKLGQILMWMSREPDMLAASQQGRRNAARLLNNATLDLLERYEDAKQRGVLSNIAVGTLEGIGMGLIDMGILGPTVEFMHFSKDQAVTDLRHKIDGLVDSLGQKLEGEELKAGVYEKLTDVEINLLESAENYYRAVEAVGKDFPQVREFSNMAGRGLVGAVEFFATGGTGWLRQVVRVGGKVVMRKAAKEGAEELVKYWRKGTPSFTNKLLKAGGGMAKNQLIDATESALQTLVQPSFYNDVGDRILQGDTTGTAWAGAFYDKCVDNYTARLFGGVPVFGPMAKGKVGKLAELGDKVLNEYSEEIIADFMKRIPDWNERGFEQAYADFWEDKANVLYSTALLTGMVEGAKAMAGVHFRYGRDSYREMLPKDYVDEVDLLVDHSDITNRETLRTIGAMVKVTALKEGIEQRKLIENTQRYLVAKYQMKGMEYMQDARQLRAQEAVENVNAGKENNKTKEKAKEQPRQLPPARTNKTVEDVAKITTDVKNLTGDPEIRLILADTQKKTPELPEVNSPEAWGNLLEQVEAKAHRDGVSEGEVLEQLLQHISAQGQPVNRGTNEAVQKQKFPVKQPVGQGGPGNSPGLPELNSREAWDELDKQMSDEAKTNGVSRVQAMEMFLQDVRLKLQQGSAGGVVNAPPPLDEPLKVKLEQKNEIVVTPKPVPDGSGKSEKPVDGADTTKSNKPVTGKKQNGKNTGKPK